MPHTEFYKELDRIIADDKSDLAAWSQNYFKHHQQRYRYDLENLRKYYSSGKILEVGSAPYHLTYLIKQSGLPVTGVDIDPSRQHEFIQSVGLEIVRCNIEQEQLPFGDNSFQYIIFNEIFEHLRINPIRTLREINRVLHPEGMLVLSTPNLYSVRNIVHLLLGRGFDNPYSEFNKLETIGHMGHVREYSVAQVKEFLKNTGYNVFRSELISHYPLKGMWALFNPVRKMVPTLHSYQVHFCRKA